MDIFEKFKRLFLRRCIDNRDGDRLKRKMRDKLFCIGKCHIRRNISADGNKADLFITVLRRMRKCVHGCGSIIESVVTDKNKFHGLIITQRAPFFKGRAGKYCQNLHNILDGTGEQYNIADVLHACHVHDEAIESETEPAVRSSTELS